MIFCCPSHVRRLLNDQHRDGFEQGEKLDLRHVGGGDGFAVGQLRSGSALHFPNIRNAPAGRARLFVRLANGGGGRAGRLAVFNQTERGRMERLGSCQLESTGGWQSYREVSCGSWEGEGLLHLVLRVEGGAQRGGGEMLRIDWVELR